MPALGQSFMISPTLLVLAAGLGSRYGGLKQLDPVGPGNETLLDYSVHDALRAGFDRVVFLIRRDIEEEFRAKIGARYAGRIAVDYAFQEIDDLPHGFTPPPGRTKPWGTAHAVWCAREIVAAPFVSINADDFYGADSFVQLSHFLARVDTAASPATFALAGYRLDRTLSKHGSVARGCCTVASDGLLQNVEECTGLSRRPDGTIGEGDRTFPPETLVSMNFWGFTPQIFDLLEGELRAFLTNHGDSLTAEAYLPSAVTAMITSHGANVRVLATEAAWFGVTYREDRSRVVASLAELVRSGAYPPKLGL